MTEQQYNSLSPKLQNAYTRLCMSVDTNISLDRVILSEENRHKIDDFITETKYKDKFMEHGLKPVNRLIFYGASGTGKTFLSKALANYFGYEMLYVDIAGALSAGIAAESLHDIFDVANELKHCVIFLDECDAICWARDDKDNDDDASIRRANNALFQLLDQMSPLNIFISATNLYNNLDPAFVNRFNDNLRFERPLITNLDESIQKLLLPAFTIEDDMDEKIKSIVLDYARNFTELSYRRIEDWVERSEKKAIIDGTTVVKLSDVYSYFMRAMRIIVCYDKEGAPYLHHDS